MRARARFCIVAKAATKSRLPLAVEGGHADEVDVSEGIHHRTDLPANGRSAAVPEPVAIAQRSVRQKVASDWHCWTDSRWSERLPGCSLPAHRKDASPAS